MYRLLFLLVAFLSVLSRSQANGVGSPLKEVLKDDFATFFNLEQTASMPLPFGQKQLHYKTGGFKEYIDLMLVVDRKNTLLSAHLEVNYKFIKEQPPFAIDVIKSFLQDFCHQEDEAVCATLATRLFKGEGEVAPELAGVMVLLGNKKKWDCSTLKASVLNTATQKEVLAFSYHFINWEMQPVPTKVFLTGEDLKAYPLQLHQEEADFRVWTASKEEEENSQFYRLVDGRWQFKTAVIAYNYYKAYKLQQSEGMALLEGAGKGLGEECFVYETGPAQREMMATLGLEVEEEFYCFLIRKGKTIAKVFVVVSLEGSLEAATSLAKKAAQHL